MKTVHHALVQELHRWWGLLDGEFKLDVPQFALRIDRLEWFVLGHYRRGHNSFGLRHEVAINSLHLDTRPPWQVIGTLFHEMLHATQAKDQYGAVGDSSLQPSLASSTVPAASYLASRVPRTSR